MRGASTKLENKNDLLQIVCGFHALPLPQRGSKLVCQPFEHIQATQYMRPSISSLGFDERHLDSKLAAAEEAFSLSLWTIATICRVLSVESILPEKMLDFLDAPVPFITGKDGEHALWLNKAPEWVLSELKGKEFEVPVVKSKQLECNATPFITI